MTAVVADLAFARLVRAAAEDELEDRRPVWIGVLVECPVCDETVRSVVHQTRTDRLECHACGSMYARVAFSPFADEPGPLAAAEMQRDAIDITAWRWRVRA